MAIVDEQGRLFGRLNLLDAVLLVLLVGLVPLGLAAYSLFREKPPVLVSVTPNRVQQTSELLVTVRGENLRPYMRVSAGSRQALGYLFRSTSEAEIPFGSLPVGEYDIILYDQAQERFRIPNGLIVEAGPLPATQIVAVGAFGNLDAARAAEIVPGLSLDGRGEVLKVGEAAPDRTAVFSGASRVGVSVPNAMRLPAVVRLTCDVHVVRGRPECTVGDASVAPSVLLLLTTPSGQVPFMIDQTFGIEPLQPTTIEVRVTTLPEILALMAAGDADRGGTVNDLAAGAVITRVGAARRRSDGTAEADVTLRADLQAAPGGWQYDSAPLRAGGSFAIRTPRYTVSGVVTAVPAPPSPANTR